jgi:hypothetical protein
MWRDVPDDPRDVDRDRPDPSRGADANSHDSNRLDMDPRDPFVRGLDLPRGVQRERIHLHDRTFEVHGGEVRLLATAGTFRIVPEADLRSMRGVRSRDVRHLEEVGLIRTMPYVIGSTRTRLITLTEQGREVLEHGRRGKNDDDALQTFYAGIAKPHELAHDAHLHRAYTAAAERLATRGARVDRVVLEEELKRAYQRFLQASNRRRADANGRPDRSAEEIAEWARAQQLPMVDDHVQFPDVRIEYDERDGRRAVEDLEVTTPHYRGAHAAAKAQAGFTQYRATGARVGGLSGSGRSGGRGFDPRLAEELLE